MKHLTKFVGLLLLAVMFQNCSQKDEVAPSKEKIQFTFDLSSAKNGRTNSSALPAGTSIRLTIKKSTGESVLTLQPVEIITLGGSIISAPVELPAGNYKVTDFLLVSSAGVVTHATPKVGSIMAALVEHPLERNFSVTSSITTNVPMEVIEVAQYSPGDFGYATFDLTVIHPLKISVFAPAPAGGWRHVSASAYVMDGPDTLQRYNLAANINLVSFNEDTDLTYTLLVIKDAHARYQLNFNYSDLIASLAGQPLKIYLTPALTLINHVDLVSSDLFETILDGTAGANITVDWGDGTSTPYTFGSSSLFLDHNYTTTRNFVTITGNINMITSFYAFYGDGMIDRINLDYVTELNELRMGLTRSPRTIDLTHNPKIATLWNPNLDNTRTILLPTINKIITVDVPSPQSTVILAPAVPSKIVSNKSELTRST